MLSTAIHLLTGAAVDDLSRRLEERISEFTLGNGLHFIVLERHNAPIVSCHTYANVGAFDEADGQTGVLFDATLMCEGCWSQCKMSPSTRGEGMGYFFRDHGFPGLSAGCCFQWCEEAYCLRRPETGRMQESHTCWNTWLSRALDASARAITSRKLLSLMHSMKVRNLQPESLVQVDI